MKQRIKAQFKHIGDLPTKITDNIGSTKSLLVHTFLFMAIFSLRFFGVATNDILLILTTAVSLEAIYLSIFIQMTVNRNTQSLEEVEEDIEEIQKDVDEIQEDVVEIDKGIDEMEAENEFDKIEQTLRQLIADVETLKKKN